jgi:hypothetical protein
MPRGPKGEKRPADVIGMSVMVARIATGEIDDPLPSGRSKGGKAGGKARAKALSGPARKKIARKAAAARWSR